MSESRDLPANPFSCLVCPGCASGNTRAIGAIPPSNSFAGRLLEKEREGGNLQQCLNCHLLFRYPRPIQSELNRLYLSGDAGSWPAPAGNRNDWRLIREWISGHAGLRRILDVGCFDGRLLEYLGQGYEWLGVEIHEEASRRARSRGVKMVGNDFASLSSLNPDADVVLAVDVIEHSLDPETFLASLAACAHPGGYIMVSTGNTEAPSWRWMGSRYWYCHIAEHMSFINPTWARTAAPKLGLRVEHLALFSHAEGEPVFSQKAYETSANLMLLFAPWLFSLFRRLGTGGIDLARYPGMALAPPYWLSSRDHLLIVFRKN